MSETIDERPGPAIYPADFGKGTKKELAEPIEELDPPVPVTEPKSSVKKEQTVAPKKPTV